MNVPIDPAAQAVRESAALFDLSDWSILRLTGRDAASFLHNFCTADIKGLKPGAACEAFITNVKARVVGHVVVTKLTEDDEANSGPSLLLFGSPGQNEKLAAHLDRYLIREEVTIEDCTASTTVTFVCGQDAVRFRKDGFVRLDLFGIPGALIVHQNDRGNIANELTTVGAIPGSSELLESLRIEACFPYYGIDVTEDHLAPEVGRPWAINYNKGCYLGQEPIARIDALGHVNKLLRGVRLEDGPIPEPGAAVIAEGKEIGVVTSAAMSPEDGKPIAMAWLRTKFSDPGTVVSVRIDSGETLATVFGPCVP